MPNSFGVQLPVALEEAHMEVHAIRMETREMMERAFDEVEQRLIELKSKTALLVKSKAA